MLNRIEFGYLVKNIIDVISLLVQEQYEAHFEEYKVKEKQKEKEKVKHFTAAIQYI